MFICEGLRVSGDQRHITPALPMHLADVLNVGPGMQNLVDTSGKNNTAVILSYFIFPKE